MANILEVSMIEKIVALSELGWSIRKVSRELGVHRDTVKKYRPPESKCTGVTAGDSGENGAKCTTLTTGSADESTPKCTGLTTGTSQSKCRPYDEFIRDKLEAGLNAQRIFQDLQAERAFEGSYESVKRYARKIEECTQVPFRRMEVLPGTECQVDYGTGAWIVSEDGKRRKTHLFRIVLSCSRKAYSEVSFTQETECFLRALENAFRHFGGVPETVVIDNLKAGVIKPCVYDPELNPKLRDFAAHYPIGRYPFQLSKPTVPT
jgi:transposase